MRRGESRREPSVSPGVAGIEEPRRQLVADLIARRRQLGLSQAEIATSTPAKLLDYGLIDAISG